MINKVIELECIALKAETRRNRMHMITSTSHVPLEHDGVASASADQKKHALAFDLGAHWQLWSIRALCVLGVYDKKLINK